MGRPHGEEFRDSYGDEELRKFDKYVHAVTVISEPHRLAHDGFMFHASKKETGILNAGVEECLFITGTKPVHLNRWRVESGGGDIDIDIYEGATVSANGTALSVHCTNRLALNTALTTLYDGPTVTDDGTLIHSQWVPPTSSGIGQSADGAQAEAGEEWILAPNTNYLIRVTNNSGDTISIWEEYLFYEVGYEV